MNISTVCNETNNSILLVGNLSTPFVDSHKNHGRSFCKATLNVKRLSGVEDLIPLVVDKAYLEMLNIKEGMTIQVKGILKTYFRPTQYKCVEMYVFADVLTVLPSNTPHRNEVWLRAKMSMYHHPVLRFSPLGRQLVDFTLQQGNRYSKHTYNFQCVAWGSVAREITRLEQGKIVTVVGRLQSRIYNKQTEYDTVIPIMTREVSVCRLLETI